ncbi:MAG: matrixin family metalloprotease [Planctomycetes bacterium]|nr:matrixin family metalloprotease [Planctomycetota bacterium]
MNAMRVALLALIAAVGLLVAGGDVGAYTSIRVPVGPAGQGLPVRWDLNNVAALPNVANRRVLYEIGDSGCADAANFLGPINEFQAVQDAFANWRNVNESEINFEFTGATTNEATSANDNRNVVRWVGSNISTGVFAVTITTFDTTTGRIVDADMQLNDRDFTWNTLGATATQGIVGRSMIENVVTHEIGHIVGLDHSQVSASTMYFASSPGLIEQTVIDRDTRAPIINDYTNAAVTDASLGIVQGQVTTSGSPAFGVEVLLINFATGRVVMGGISEGSAGPFAAGSYQIANVPPGVYLALATPVTRANLGGYYSTAFTSFYPILRGINVGTLGAPTLVKVGPGQTVSSVDLALPSASQNPLEPDGGSGTASAILSGQAGVSSISPSSDEDWYSFTTTQAGQTATIRVIADGFGSSLNPTLTLYDSNGSTILVSPNFGHPAYQASANDIDADAFDLNGANFDAEVTHTFSGTGTYFFKVQSRVAATTGRYVVLLELAGADTSADSAASGIEASVAGIAANSGGNFTVTVTPRNAFSRDLNAPSTFTVELLDVTSGSPVTLQTITSGTTPFGFTVPALSTAQLKRYGARINSVQIAQTVEVVHYGTLSLANSRIVLLEGTLNANGYDRIPVRIELRDGGNNRLPDGTIAVTLDTSRGSLANGTSSGATGVAAVFDAVKGWWTITLVAGTSAGTANLTAYANSQQIDTAVVTILPRATGTGGGAGGGGGGGGSDDDDDGGCAVSGGGKLWAAIALMAMAAAVLWRRRRKA